MTTPTAPDEGQGLTARTLSGATWSFGSVLVTAGLQLAATAVLARLLEPASFGLIAMALLALRFGQYFAQMGLGQALVQAKTVEPRHISGAHLGSVLLGAMMTAAMFVAAPLFGRLMRAPELVPVLRGMAFVTFFGGFSVAPLALMRREMRFRAIALVEIGSYVLGYIGCGLMLALAGLEVWALVAASLAQVVLMAAAVLVIARAPLTSRRAVQGLQELSGFGSRVSAVGFLEFIASNLDTLAVGRLLGDASLGFYSRGLNMANLPLQHVSAGLSRVLLPSFARMQQERERMREAHTLVSAVFAYYALPVSGGIAACAPVIVGVLLGRGWQPVVPVLEVTCLIAPLTTLTHFSEVVAEAVAALKAKFWLRIAQVGVFAVLLLALSPYGLVGFALAFAGSEALLWVAYIVFLRRVLGHGRRELRRIYAFPVIFGMVAYVTLLMERWALDAIGSPVFVSFVVLLLSGIALVAALTRWGARGVAWSEIRLVLDKAGLCSGEGRMARLVEGIDGLGSPL